MAAFVLSSGGGYDFSSLGDSYLTTNIFGKPTVRSPMNFGLIGAGIGAVGGLVTGYYSSRIQKTQARMQQRVAEFNQRQAERNAQLALMQSQQRIGQISRKYEGIKSSQKAAMAANGIVLGVGSAAEVVTTTDIDKEISINNEYANGMREAWGYRMQGVGYGQQAANANSLAQQADSLSGALSTGITSGINAYNNYLLLNKNSVKL